MTRGPAPKKGLDAALLVAEARGNVTTFAPSPKNPGDFLIEDNAILAIARVRRVKRLHAPAAEIETEFSDAVHRLRAVAGGGPVSRELWLYSRYGVLRFFRIEDAGIVELDRSGAILVPPPRKRAPDSPAQSFPVTGTSGGEHDSSPVQEGSGG